MYPDRKKKIDVKMKQAKNKIFSVVVQSAIQLYNPSPNI